MKCMICDRDMSFYFHKEISPYHKHLLSDAEYWQCDNCNFVESKTVVEMPYDEWVKLNCAVHTMAEQSVETNLTAEERPPYIEQATLIKILDQNGLIDASDIMDYAGGHGTCSKILKKYFGMHMPVYDPYMTDENSDVAYISGKDLKKYKTVFNSAMFEHIRSRKDIDVINDCVIGGGVGVLLMHTVICGKIPKSAHWFFSESPVHCAFHTNKSMQILMDEWGYESSLYCPRAMTWCFFRKEPDNVLERIAFVNKELQTDYLYYKKGFMDYYR